MLRVQTLLDSFIFSLKTRAEQESVWACWGIYSEIKRSPCAPCQMPPPQPGQGPLVAQCSLGPEASSGLVPVYHGNRSKLGWSEESGTKEVPGWKVPGPGLYTATPWRGSVVSLLHMRRPMYRGQETSSETQSSAHVTGLHVLCPWQPTASAPGQGPGPHVIGWNVPVTGWASSLLRYIHIPWFKKQTKPSIL